MKKPDLTKRYLGAPCHKGHSGWRYRRGGACVECATIKTRDRNALRSDAIHASRAHRRDEFKAAIDRAAEHLYQAGLELWTAKDMGVHGLRQELARHGLMQRLAADLRRYAYKRQTGQDWKTRKSASSKASDHWLEESVDDCPKP